MPLLFCLSLPDRGKVHYYSVLIFGIVPIRSYLTELSSIVGPSIPIVCLVLRFLLLRMESFSSLCLLLRLALYSLRLCLPLAL